MSVNTWKWVSNRLLFCLVFFALCNQIVEERAAAKHQQRTKTKMKRKTIGLLSFVSFSICFPIKYLLNKSKWNSHLIWGRTENEVEKNKTNNHTTITTPCWRAMHLNQKSSHIWRQNDSGYDRVCVWMANAKKRAKKKPPTQQNHSDQHFLFAFRFSLAHFIAVDKPRLSTR